MLPLAAATIFFSGNAKDKSFSHLLIGFFFVVFLCRYRENLKVHAIRVMAVIEKTMHRLDDEKRAATVSKIDKEEEEEEV